MKKSAIITRATLSIVIPWVIIILLVWGFYSALVALGMDTAWAAVIGAAGGFLVGRTVNGLIVGTIEEIVKGIK